MRALFETLWRCGAQIRRLPGIAWQSAILKGALELLAYHSVHLAAPPIFDPIGDTCRYNQCLYFQDAGAYFTAFCYDSLGNYSPGAAIACGGSSISEESGASSCRLRINGPNPFSGCSVIQSEAGIKFLLFGYRIDVPNQELVRELAARPQPDAVRELVANLRHPRRAIQSDCIKTLYEIGYRSRSNHPIYRRFFKPAEQPQPDVDRRTRTVVCGSILY